MSRRASDHPHNEESLSTVRHALDGWHYLPLAFAVIPPLGAALHGRAEGWTDSMILVIIAFYLYQLIRGQSPDRHARALH
jgi:hypothetical protein